MSDEADDEAVLSLAACEPPLTELDTTTLTCTPASITALNLSRNRLAALPDALGDCLCALRQLDVSRNQLRALPLGLPGTLTSLNALSNSLRPMERSLPPAVLAPLHALTLLDLRFNSKLKANSETAAAIAARLPAECTVLLTEVVKGAAKPSAATRDASQLRSQLEPLSTPQLAKRLERAFGIPTDLESTGREEVLTRLVGCYEERNSAPRPTRRVAGTPLGPLGRAAMPQLLEELRATTFPVGDKRERPKIRAEGYIILQRPAEAASEATGEAPASGGSTKARLAHAKLLRHARIWELASVIMHEADPEYARLYTAVAVTKQFQGSPHIDTENVAPFYGFALGDYAGGFICVEAEDGMSTYEVDTQARLGKVDGRYPHWVSPHTGERFSIIYYQTSGAVVPQGPSVFAPPQPDAEQRL